MYIKGDFSSLPHWRVLLVKKGKLKSTLLQGLLNTFFKIYF